jgi:hypothetical protein
MIDRRYRWACGAEQCAQPCTCGAKRDGQCRCAVTVHFVCGGGRKGNAGFSSSFLLATWQVIEELTRSKEFQDGVKPGSRLLGQRAGSTATPQLRTGERRDRAQE